MDGYFQPQLYDLHLLAVCLQRDFMCVKLRADVELFFFFSIFCGKGSEELNQTNTRKTEKKNKKRQ